MYFFYVFYRFLLIFTDFYRFIRIFWEISGNFRKLREISKPIFTDNDRSHLIERSRTIYIVHARSGTFLNEPNYIVLNFRITVKVSPFGFFSPLSAATPLPLRIFASSQIFTPYPKMETA